MAAARNPQRASDAMLDAFVRAYAARVPFREDRVLTEDLRAEVAPVLEALADAVTQQTPLAQAHEAYALVTLLTRRAGLLGATPTAAHALAQALVDALAEGGLEVSVALHTDLLVVAFEGFCAGRDERTSAELLRELARCQTVVELAPRCLVAFLAGQQDPDLLASTLDELARSSLQRDVASCLFDVSRLNVSREDVARQLFGCIVTLLSLGNTVVVVGQGRDFEEQRARFADVVSGVVWCASFDEGLKLVLAAAGYELKARRRWPKDLFTRAPKATSRQS